MKLIHAAPILFLIITGCTITGKSEVKTGLFENNLEKLSDAYQTVDQMGNNKIDRKAIETMGFDFNAINVERVPGFTAFRRIFGDNVFQNALNKPENVGELLKEMNQYYAFYIPYHDVMTHESRFYFSTKETERTGDDLMILFIFKREKTKEGIDRDVLAFHDYNFVKINSKESSSAFAQGLLEVIDKYGGFGANIQTLIDKIKALMGKD